MKSLMAICMGFTFLSLTACSKMPSECEESWDKMAEFGKSMGVSKEEIKQKKQEFENSISQMDVKEAKKLCESQKEFLNLN